MTLKANMNENKIKQKVILHKYRNLSQISQKLSAKLKATTARFDLI